MAKEKIKENKKDFDELNSKINTIEQEQESNNKICKKHNIKYLKYININHKIIYSCPVCNNIKNTRYRIKQIKENLKRSIKNFKREKENIKQDYKERIQRAEEDIKYKNENPLIIYEREIKERAEMKERFKIEKELEK